MIFKKYGTTTTQLFHPQGVQKCKEKSLQNLKTSLNDGIWLLDVELNIRRPFSLTYLKSDQSKHKKIQKKYRRHPKTNKEPRKLYINEGIWQNKGWAQSLLRLSLVQNMVFLQDKVPLNQTKKSQWSKTVKFNY